ncbi:hypothetical protein [Prosthecobacter sp.]|uniref:hypothetical protein n=1 Tax=Prosthecobacter sp. TaxID=1965333 RepID=UPI0037853236
MVAGGGPLGGAVLGALETAGGQYAETYANNVNNGMNHEQAFASSAPAAAFSGVMSGLISKAVPGGAAPLKASTVRSALSSGANRTAMNRSISDAIRAYAASTVEGAHALASGALKEIPQEVLDEAVSQVSSAYAEKRDIKGALVDFYKGMPMLLSTAGLLGAGGEHISRSHEKQQMREAAAQQSQSQQQATPQAADTPQTQSQQQQPPPSSPQRTPQSPQQGQAGIPPSGIPDSTTDPSKVASASGQLPSSAAAGVAGAAGAAVSAAGKAGSPSQPAAAPSTPPKDLTTSKKLIENVTAIQEHRPLNPVEQADLAQAQKVVAQDAATPSPPSGPPPSLPTAQARIHNIMDRPPAARQHPTTQADLDQARHVVQYHVHQLENQPGPPNQAQQQALADAKAALDRLQPKDSAASAANNKGDTAAPGAQVGKKPQAAPSAANTTTDTDSTSDTATDSPRSDSSSDETSPRTDKQADARTDTQADAHSDSRSDPTADAKLDTQSDQNADAQTDAHSDSRSDLQAEPQAQTRSKPQSDARADAPSDTRSNAESDTRSGTQPSLRSDAQPDTGADTRPDAQSERAAAPGVRDPQASAAGNIRQGLSSSAQTNAGTSSSARPTVAPSTPPRSVEQSQRLLQNVAKMPAEAQRHPQVQADVAQARRVVAERVAGQDRATPASRQDSPGRKVSSQTSQPEFPQPSSLLRNQQMRGASGAAAADEHMIPWSNNPDGKKRTIPEAVEIFRQNMRDFLAKNPSIGLDLDLVEQIHFSPSEQPLAKEGDPIKWAQYGPYYMGSGINNEITWKDMFDEGKIRVKVDPRVLASDQAILGIFAHELYEIQSIRGKLQTNPNNSMPDKDLQVAIDDFHIAAIRLQNKVVKFMKAKSTQNSSP